MKGYILVDIQEKCNGCPFCIYDNIQSWKCIGVAKKNKQNKCKKENYAEIDGKPIMVFKDPKTDRESGHAMKKSQKGIVYVYRDKNGEITFKDGYTSETIPSDNLLETVFKNGKLVKECTFEEVRNRLHGGKND